MTAVADSRDSTMDSPTAVEVMAITPRIATEWLEANVHNRRVRDARIEQLAGAMKRGEWTFNGESIKFDLNGNLIDGQHRLLAIVASGVSLPMLVTRGLSLDAQETVDIGAKRSVGDMLKLRGYTNVNALAAAARLVLTYHKYGTLQHHQPNFTAQQLIARVEQDSGLVDSVKFGMRLKGAITGSQAVWATTHFLAHEVDESDATVFFERLVAGVPPIPGDPIHQLRKAVISEGLKSNRRAEPVTVAAWTVKAFNAWREGREISLLVWKRGGATREPFPQFKDHPNTGDAA